MNQAIEASHSRYSLLLHVFHDWLAKLTDHPYLLAQYDTTAFNVICDKLKDKPIGHWVDRLVNTNDLHSLLCRHYALKEALDEPIRYDGHYTPLYLAMVSMYHAPCRYSKLDDSQLLDYLKFPFSISDIDNIVRFSKKDLISLANRQDVEDHRLDKDHSMLSSFTLVYVLSLLALFLDYELRLNPSTHLEQLVQDLYLTISYLKGLFSNV